MRRIKNCSARTSAKRRPAGISYPEGKWVFIGCLAAGVWVVLGLLQPRWLPGGLLAAGAMATFATVIQFALRSRLAAQFAVALANMREEERMLKSIPFANVGAKAAEEMGSTLVPTVSGGVGLALGLAILTAITAAVAFALASLRRPQRFAVFDKPDTAPVLRRYGALLAGYGLAFLIGLAFAVIRY